MNKVDYVVLGAILAATLIGATVFITSGMEKQPVDAAPTSCINCAKNFAPGQEAEDPTGAEDFALGHIDKLTLF